jgi:hypothetical protein
MYLLTVAMDLLAKSPQACGTGTRSGAPAHIFLYLKHIAGEKDKRIKTKGRGVDFSIFNAQHGEKNRRDRRVPVATPAKRGAGERVWASCLRQ